MSNFDRDLAVVLEVLGKVNRRHPAGAYLALDGVAVGKSIAQTLESVGHVALRVVPRVNSRLGSLSIN